MNYEELRDSNTKLPWFQIFCGPQFSPRHFIRKTSSAFNGLTSIATILFGLAVKQLQSKFH